MILILITNFDTQPRGENNKVLPIWRWFVSSCACKTKYLCFEIYCKSMYFSLFFIIIQWEHCTHLQIIHSLSINMTNLSFKIFIFLIDISIYVWEYNCEIHIHSFTKNIYYTYLMFMNIFRMPFCFLVKIMPHSFIHKIKKMIL